MKLCLVLDTHPLLEIISKTTLCYRMGQTVVHYVHQILMDFTDLQP